MNIQMNQNEKQCVCDSWCLCASTVVFTSHRFHLTIVLQLAIEQPGKSNSTYRAMIKEEWHTSPCNVNATAKATPTQAASADGSDTPAQASESEVKVDSTVFAAEDVSGLSAADLE